jgi:magnesium chelatase family protein
MTHRKWASTIHVDVRRVPFEKLAGLEGGESSATIRARVEWARKVQEARFKAWTKAHILVNDNVGPAEVQHFCQLGDAVRNLMRAAVKQMNLSARSYHRVLKLRRMIADLAGAEKIEVAHLPEAIQSLIPDP